MTAFVQLRYEFLENGGPLAAPIARSYLSFYDFDSGWSQVSGAVPAVECLQLGPQATKVDRTMPSQISQQSQEAFVAGLSSAAQAVAVTMQPAWGTPVYLASMYGVGNDNP